MASERLVAIYALLEPSTGAIRYIGRSVRPEKRCHGRGIEGWKLLHWLDELRKLKLRPKLQVIATVPHDTAPLAERLAIWIAREMGAELVNTQLNTTGKKQ